MNSTDDYGSPPEVWGPCLEAVGLRAFDLDPCSHRRSDGAYPVPARRVFTLAEPWPAVGGKRKVRVRAWTRATIEACGVACEGRRPVVWLNPPYSQPEGWARAAAEAVDSSAPANAPDGVVTFALVRMSVGCGWWRQYMGRFWGVGLGERLAFITADGTPSPAHAMFDCALIVCAPDEVSRQLAAQLGPLGQIIAPTGWTPPLG